MPEKINNNFESFEGPDVEFAAVEMALDRSASKVFSEEQIRELRERVEKMIESFRILAGNLTEAAKVEFVERANDPRDLPTALFQDLGAMGLRISGKIHERLMRAEQEMGEL